MYLNDSHSSPLVVSSFSPYSSAQRVICVFSGFILESHSLGPGCRELARS